MEHNNNNTQIVETTLAKVLPRACTKQDLSQSVFHNLFTQSLFLKALGEHIVENTLAKLLPHALCVGQGVFHNLFTQSL